jgi:DNA-binding FrmR family transcriptional regulator
MAVQAILKSILQGELRECLSKARDSADTTSIVKLLPAFLFIGSIKTE